MNGRKTLLGVLRRHRDRLGRIVLAGFALASFTISGAPCYAMASGNGDVAAIAGHHAYAHSGHEIGHADGAVTHHESLAQNGLPHCPHCPPAMPNHAPSSAHSYCSAGDELA